MEYKKRREEQSRQTEQRILRSALELMRERGYEKVSIRDICAHAEVTTGAFYHHFPSKEALVARGFGALDHYVEQVVTTKQENTSPVERLRIILGAYADFMERESGSLTARYYRMRLDNAETGVRLDPTGYVKKAMVDCFRATEEIGIFSVDRSPEWLARFCYAHFRGLVIDWMLSGYAYSLRDRMLDEFQTLIDLFQKRTPEKE